MVLTVYNAGCELDRCLQSLQKQTLKEIEFICVLDAPTDGSDKVIRQYAQADERFVVVRNEVNMGVAESRNLGVQHARGEYIGFCDHDDWCEENMFSSLYAKAKEGDFDVALSDTMIELPNQRQVAAATTTDANGILQSVLLPEDSALCRNKLARSVWHSVYKRTFIEKHNIQFYDRKHYLEEDTLFNCQVFAQTDRVGRCAQAFYHWNLTRVAENQQYGQHTQIEPFVNYFQVVKQYVSSEILLTQVMTAQFYLYWQYYRKENDEYIVDCLRENIRFLKPDKIVQIYGKKRIMKNGLMYLKFVRYVHQLKHPE